MITTLVAAAAWLSHSPPLEDIAPTDRYDPHFKKYSKRYFSVLADWRWFKAQSFVESSLKRNAVSDRGAVGMMQVMPGTYNEVLEPYSDLFPITDPKWNIATGIALNRYFYDRWAERVPPEQGVKFALASYNAGFSRILQTMARARARGADDQRWAEVAPHASGETREYVERIYELMGREL